MWLDNCPDCVGGRAGLVLILLHEDERGKWYDNLTGGACSNWKRAFGTRVVLSRTGVKALEGYFRDKGSVLGLVGVDIPKYVEQLNPRWLMKNRAVVETPDGLNYYVYPPLDLVDRHVIQEGLNKGWEEVPGGVPGLQVLLGEPYESEEGWVAVNVGRRFARFPGVIEAGVAELLPCKGVLAWDSAGI